MKAKIIIMICSVVALFSSCTQNNGDLDGLFGAWKVESITADGEVDAGYDGDMIWKFQNNIVALSVVGDNHYYVNHMGTFTREGNTLVFNFTHSDDAHPPVSGAYVPPAQSHFPASIFGVTILKLTGSEMKLQYIDNQGVTYIYNLKKWG